MEISSLSKIWSIDFEFGQDKFGKPDIVCMVAKELRSGETKKLFSEQLQLLKCSPFDEEDCLIAYYASAEMMCFLKLGWKFPKYLIDLYVEFRNFSNGLPDYRGGSLLHALSYFGFSWIDAATKDKFRELAIRGGPFTEKERQDLLEYCETDVIAAEKIFEKVSGSICLREALLRGEFIKCIAKIENNGIPVNTEFIRKIADRWPKLKRDLIDEVNQKVPVFKNYKFNSSLFKLYLAKNGYAWPYNEKNKLDLRDDTFKDMIKFCPSLGHLSEVRYLSSQLKLTDIPVFADSRARCSLGPFGSKTGRNQPSTAKFIFGPSAWVRNLIQPPSGSAIAYIDWSQQEFGIAAALSGDENMKSAYLSGDPYIEFAKFSKAVPPEATKKSHAEIREVYKACVLAVQYGMEGDSLAERIQSSISAAEDLLTKHKRIFSRFWIWSDQVVNYAASKGLLKSCYGWTLKVGGHTKYKTITNYLMQANGAEMLRHACIELCKTNVNICATVHDAILIEAPIDKIEEHVLLAQQAMENASKVVLGGFGLSSEAKVFKSPNSFSEKRGEEMWAKIVNQILKDGTKGAPHD